MFVCSPTMRDEEITRQGEWGGNTFYIAVDRVHSMSQSLTTVVS